MRFSRWLFPKWSWAFPGGDHHQLLLAAIGSHHAQSLAAARNWLYTQDVDTAQFRDHRLLLAIVARFGQELRDHSAYPRLVGLQRMLWTKSQLAIREATPSLHRLRGAGIELLLIKGVSRRAVDEAAGKQRVAWDIDVVVKPDCMQGAFDILIAENWSPAPGTSHQYLREHLASTRSINLFRGDFGDLDLHSRPFHPGQGGENEDAALWEASQTISFAGTSVFVPSSEDRIALAIAHGGLDGHTHSDWLVDCAPILRADMCDWERLQAILLSRHLAVPAAIAFHYLKDALDFDIPISFLKELSSGAIRRPFAIYSGLIQARPKDRMGPLGQVLRAIAKKQRKVAGIRRMPARIKDRELSVRRVRCNRRDTPEAFVWSYCLDRPVECRRQGTLDINILLDVRSTSTRRRIEMEINSASTHFCRIRFRHWIKKQGPLRLRLSGTIVNPAADETLELVSRPSKQLRSYANASERERYERVPFRVITCSVQ
jgi:hypothetical protein